MDIRLRASLRFVLASAACMARNFEQNLSATVKGVDANIVAFEMLAYTVPALAQAVMTRHKEERWGELLIFSIDINSTKALMPDLVERWAAKEWGDLWRDRFLEYHRLNDPMERFTHLCYLVEAAKGAKVPMSRYPGVAPVSLNLMAGLETMPGFLTSSEVILQAVEAAVEFHKLLPSPDEDDEE